MKRPARSHTPRAHSLHPPTLEEAGETRKAAGETAWRFAPPPTEHRKQNLSTNPQMAFPHSQKQVDRLCDESSHRTSPDTTHHFSLQNTPRDLFDRESEERRDPTCRWEDRSTLVFTRCSHIHRLHQCFLLFLRPFSMCLHGGRKIMQVVLVRVEGNLVPQTTTILLPSGVRFGIVAILQRDLRLLVRGLLDRSY